MQPGPRASVTVAAPGSLSELFDKIKIVFNYESLYFISNFCPGSGDSANWPMGRPARASALMGHDVWNLQCIRANGQCVACHYFFYCCSFCCYCFFIAVLRPTGVACAGPSGSAVALIRNLNCERLQQECRQMQLLQWELRHLEAFP